MFCLCFSPCNSFNWQWINFPQIKTTLPLTANGNPPLHLNLQAFPSYFLPTTLLRRRSEREAGRWQPGRVKPPQAQWKKRTITKTVLTYIQLSLINANMGKTDFTWVDKKIYPERFVANFFPLCLLGSTILGERAGAIFPLSLCGRHHLGRCISAILGVSLFWRSLWDLAILHLMIIYWVFLPAAVLLVSKLLFFDSHQCTGISPH